MVQESGAWPPRESLYTILKVGSSQGVVGDVTWQQEVEVIQGAGHERRNITPYKSWKRHGNKFLPEASERNTVLSIPWF